MKRTEHGWIASSIRTLEAMPVFRPSTIEEAVAKLSGSEPPAVVAGGTDLVAQFNEGFAPRGLLALRDIGALREIAVTGGRLRIGSCVTHDAGSRSEIVRDAAPGFAAAWGRIANVRVRMTATIGGNIMARRTRYEMPILLGALEAEFHFEGALLVAVSIPLDGLLAFDYDRSLRPVMTQAVCLRRRPDGSLALRAAIGTEDTAPHHFGVPVANRALRESAVEIARDAYDAFPADFADRYTSNTYLRRAGSTIFKRQLERLAHAPI